jgi:hypothetical protein
VLAGAEAAFDGRQALVGLVVAVVIVAVADLVGGPLELVSQEPDPDDGAQTLVTWRLNIQEVLHAGAEGPTQVLQGVLRDAVGHEVSLADALPCPVPTVTLDFTPPEVLVPVPFAHVLDGAPESLTEIITTSSDSVSLSVQAWSCVGDGPCFGAAPDTWQVAGVSTVEPLDVPSVAPLEPGQWSLPLGMAASGMPDGRYAIAAMVTDRVGLTSKDCEGPLTGEGCWVGKLVVDSAPPVVHTSGLTMGDDTPLAAKLKGGDAIRITAEVSDLLASRDDSLNPLVVTVRVGNVAIPEALGAPCDPATVDTEGCCAIVWSGKDNGEAALDCRLEIDADSPSGPVSVVLEVSDGAHQAEAATMHTIGALHIDNDAPTVTLEAYQPPVGTTATASASLSVSLSFDEEVVLTDGTLWASLLEDPDQTIGLTHAGEMSAAVHTWSGAVFEGVVSGTYQIEPNVHDVAGNPYVGGSLEAFEIDTDFLVLDGLVLTVTAAEDGAPPAPGYAGVGDTIAVAVSVADDADWSLNTSQVDLDGLPLTWHDTSEVVGGDGSESWGVTVEAAAHATFGGLRDVGGVLRDDAGNEAPFEAAVATWGGAWPSVTIDTRSPDLAIPTQINRCDGYAPAQEAENRLHVKAGWSEGECPSSWGLGSCSDPTAPATSDVPAPIRLTFVLDEPIQLSSAVIIVGDSGVQAVVDHCLSYDAGAAETTKVVAWFDPKYAESGEHEVTLQVSDLAGNAVGRTNGELLVDVAVPEAPAVDVAGVITLYRYPWAAEGHDPNSSILEGLTGAAEPGARVFVYAATDVTNAQLLNMGSTDGALVDDDGAFETQLLPGDRAEVFIQVRDTAGNLSDGDPTLDGAQATRVRDVSWTATLGSKIPGSELANPHTLTAMPWFRDSLTQFKSASVELGASDGVVTSGSPYRTTGSARWLNRNSPKRPSPRAEHHMSYDAARGVSVLFGGDTSALIYGLHNPATTWEWDGVRWTDVLPPGQSPPWRFDGVFAYDARRGVSVLFGGDVLEQYHLQDLWEWDGEAWVERVPLDGVVPLPRSMAAMAYDTRRGVMLLFGGEVNGLGPDGVSLAKTGEEGHKEPSADFWEWDGERWTEKHLDGPRPSARSGHTMTYDEDRGVVVLYGGYGPKLDEEDPDDPHCQISECSARWLGDTWEWDGETWTEGGLTGATPPPAQNVSLTFHKGLGKSLLFGTNWDYVRINWLWDGATWTEVPWTDGEEPSTRRISGGMVYDKRRGVVVLVAGEPVGKFLYCQDYCADDPSPACPVGCEIWEADQAGHPLLLPDTWEWDGELWKFRSTGREGAGSSDGLALPGGEDDEYYRTGVSPTQRAGHEMVYDTERDVTVLFGGLWTSDVWEWDGDRWTIRAFGEDELRSGCESDYEWLDAESDGCADYEEVVLWCDDAEPWADAEGVHAGMACCVCGGGAPTPHRRVHFGMAYDTDRKTTLATAGRLTSEVPEPSSTWAWDGEGWTESPHDAHAACVSSTDWVDSRGYTCSEYYEEGAVCGDGTCNGLETCESCADDCGYCSACCDPIDSGKGACSAVDPLFWQDQPSESCQDCVCEFDSYCCDTKWDTHCAVRADNANCAGVCACRTPSLCGEASVYATYSIAADEVCCECGGGYFAPGGRSWFSMAYDRARGVGVLFGGRITSSLYVQSDLWEWNGTSWGERLAEGPWPPPRMAARMSYDAHREVSVLFGGRAPEDNAVLVWSSDDYFSVLAPFAPMDRVWEWDGVQWAETVPDGEEWPVVRERHAMAYDTQRRKLVLFGGLHYADYLQDTWEWDGETKTWSELHLLGEVPGRRSSPAMAYDEDRGVMVLYGGEASSSQEYLRGYTSTWELSQELHEEPGHLYTVSWVHALADESAALTEVSVNWSGGGVGHEASADTCLAVEGAELSVWSGGNWVAVADNTSGPGDPEGLAWSTADTAELDGLLFGRAGQQTLNFRLMPSAANTCGEQHAEVATDYAEVTVGYRLPAELPLE